MQSVLHTPRIQTLPHLGGKHERRERLRQEGGARSLPVPLSPVSNTVDAGLDATFRSSAFTSPRTRLCPTIRSTLYGCAWLARSAFTSRRNRVVSSAFSTSTAISSTLNGLFASVIDALLHRLNCGVDDREGGQHDDDGVGIGFLDRLQQRQASPSGSL